MNSDPREKTNFLAEKLRRIRDALGLSQTELLNLLELTPYYHHTRDFGTLIWPISAP